MPAGNAEHDELGGWPMGAVTMARHRADAGRTVAELLDQAAANGWDTSLLSVHARRHRPYVKLPLPSRWTWTGHLFDEHSSPRGT